MTCKMEKVGGEEDYNISNTNISFLDMKITQMNFKLRAFFKSFAVSP